MKFKFFYLLLILLSIFSCDKKKEEIVLVASASSLQNFLEEVLPKFSKKTGIKPQLIIASSGKLTHQISNGAPFDIFISANKKFPEYLKNTLAIKNDLEVFAYGKLALVSLDSINNHIWLKNSVANKIAIANPDIAPYGKATEEYLTNLKLWENVKPRLVFGESISQVNQFIFSKSINIGVTAYSSVVKSPLMKDYNIKIINDTLHKPIENIILDISDKKQNKELIQFLKTSDWVKDKLLSYGYELAN